MTQNPNCSFGIMFSSIWDFDTFFNGNTYNIFQLDSKAEDSIIFALIYGFQWIKCQISIFTSIYVLYLLSSKTLAKITNKDKAYELKVYKFISVFVAILDVVTTLTGFIFWRGIQ